MDDINEVIKKAEHHRFEEEESKASLNPISMLPSSKKRLKKSIIERIQVLVAAYSSLATFVPDETIEYIERDPKSAKTRKIYLKALDNVEKLKKEVLKILNDHATKN